MDSTAVYQAVAGILSSLPTSQGEPLSVSVLLTRQLEAAAWEKKPALAHVLAEALKSGHDENAKDALQAYIRALVSRASTNDVEQDQSYLRLAADLARGQPQLLLALVEEIARILTHVLSGALKSHSSSDDAIEVNAESFLQSYCQKVLCGTDTGIEPVAFTEDGADEEHSSTGPRQVSTDMALQHLRFLEMLLTVEIDQGALQPVFLERVAHKLPQLLLVGGGLRNKSVAKACFRVLYLLTSDCDSYLPDGISEMLWDGICMALDAAVYQDLVFGLWLRWISASTDRVRPSQTVLKQERYWMLLQVGLATGFSERRKYCLHILMTSIRLVQVSIHTRHFTFDPSRRSAIDTAWVKYSTLVDITSLSTSPNQLRAALADVKRLLDSSSPVPASWLVVLFTLGFGSNSGPVQKLLWDFLLELDDERLEELFGNGEGRSFVRDAILPYGSTAGFFVVSLEDLDHCEHGITFAGFLAKLLKNVTGRRKLALTILKFLEKQEDRMFAPARMFVLKGLFDGVKDVITFRTPENLELLLRVARMRRYAGIKKDLSVEICLRLLLSVELQQISCEEFFNALVDIVSGKPGLFSIEYAESLYTMLDRELRSIKSSAADALFDRLTQAAEAYRAGELSRMGLLKLYTSFITLMASSIDAIQRRAIDLVFSNKSFYAKAEGLRFLSLLLQGRCLSHYLVQVEVTRLLNDAATEITKMYTTCGIDDQDYISEFITLLQDLTVQPSWAGKESVWQDLSSRAWGWIQSSRNCTRELRDEKMLSVSVSICSAAAFLLPAAAHGHGIGDVVELVSGYEVPQLSSNRHKAKEAIRNASLTLSSSWRMLNKCLIDTPREDVTLVHVSQVLGKIPKLLRFLDDDSLWEVLNCMQTLASTSPSTIHGYTELSFLLAQLWETLDVSTLQARLIKVYIKFTELIFHHTLLAAALENDELLRTICSISTGLIQASTNRRSIRPSISAAVRAAYLNAPAVLCASNWLADVLIDIVNISPNMSDRDFGAESALAKLYDEVSPCKERYELYHGKPEVFAHVYIYDMMARWDVNDPVQDAFARNLRSKLFEPWTKNYPGMGIRTTWKKTSQLQTLLLTERFLDGDGAGEFLDKAIHSLTYEPHPRYRFQLEWVIVMGILRHPEHRNIIWAPVQKQDKPNAQLQAALMRVGIMVARGICEEFKEEFYIELMHTIVPLASNTKVVVRHLAISIILEVWDDATAFGLESITANTLFRRCYEAVISSAFYKQNASARSFRTFDAIANFTLAGIFAGSYLLGGEGLELIYPSSFASVSLSEPPLTIPLGSSAQTNPPGGEVEYTQWHTSQITALESASTAPLQTKAGAWDASSLLASSRRKKLHTSAADTDVIVVASLVDNNYNLGGISRVSEVLGVRELSIPHKDVLKSSEFASVSVHSEAWLDIVELPAVGIKEYLRRKRSDGYTAVGVEQTDRSVILGDQEGGNAWRFPRKTVLLLGTEKYGIPPELLGELDMCVEIPQKGQTRSMNVQTAAAVALYECMRQFRTLEAAGDRPSA